MHSHIFTYIRRLFRSEKTVVAESVKPAASTPITTAEELMKMKKDEVYHLANDIDLSGVKWHSINGFFGTFDGNGYEIKKLSSEKYGLFSTLESGATVKNVKLTNVKIISEFKTVGAIAAIIKTKTENVSVDGCFVSGYVVSSQRRYKKKVESGNAGAIIGKNNSKSTVISNCFSNAIVCSEKRVGSIVGTNKGTVSECGFSGTFGNSRNVYDFAYKEGEIGMDVYEYLFCGGGICGVNYGTVENRVSVYNDKGGVQYAGGIAGRIMPNGKVIGCVNLSNVRTSNESGHFWGLIAGYSYVKGEISNCFSLEPNEEMTKAAAKSLGQFSCEWIAEKEPGDCVDKLGEEWCIESGKPVPASIRAFVNDEPLYLIAGSVLKVNS